MQAEDIKFELLMKIKSEAQVKREAEYRVVPTMNRLYVTEEELPADKMDMDKVAESLEKEVAEKKMRNED